MLGRHRRDSRGGGPKRRRPAARLSRHLQRRDLLAGTTLAWFSLPVLPALAQDAVNTLDPARIVATSILFGAIGFSVWSAVALIRARNRAEGENAALKNELAGLKATADRAEALANADDQRLVVWTSPAEPPLVVGRIPVQSGAPDERARFLAFGTWMQPKPAAELEGAIERLRDKGESFTLALETTRQGFVEAVGRASGGRAVVRFRDLSGDRLALAALEQRHRALTDEVASMRDLLEAVPTPAWTRHVDGRLKWVNGAFVRAVEARSAEDATARNVELLDTAGREAVQADHRMLRGGIGTVARRLPAVVAGDRRIFDVFDSRTDAGGAGVALDVTEVETLQGQMKRLTEFYTRTLDQLATAVAAFGPDRRLRSYNAAFRALFGLDAGFLDSNPDEGAVLDRMRAARRLPEQADFKSWRKDLLSAYQAIEAREHWWHLPDGQTLRVISNPHPQGGITWIYENFTERLELESRYNALSQVQGETLDHLSEGVAVFGSDGRLRLHNPAFARIWRLDVKFLSGHPHVAEFERACRRLHDDAEEWARFSARVAGLDEGRATTAGRMERQDRRVVDYATIPLPGGQTMVTFVDVTDTVQVERALTDRNEALEAADRLKNDFIQHVSYELRSPLTNIIGFAQLLADVAIGPLNDKQREYTGYILSSSSSLLAIVNDILDLATVDAGIIALDLKEIDVADTVAAAVEGVRDRLQEAELKLETHIARGIGTVVADEKRVRQILYNLLSNAVGFSKVGGAIRLSVRRRADQIEFIVEDEGTGIPAEFIDSAFDRFESRSHGGNRGGVGLGLAIVKSFVELHGGSVSIRSAPGEGTTVTVRLPIHPNAIAEAAE